MIYEGPNLDIPSVDVLTFLFDDPNGRAADDTPLHAEARDPQRYITKAQLRKLTGSFAHFLRTEYGIGANGPNKDVVVPISTGQSALAALLYGVIAAEGIYAPVSHTSPVEDAVRQIKDGPGKVIVCSSDAKDLAIAAAARVGLPERNVLVLTSYPDVTLKSANGEVACDFKQQLPWRKITDPKELKESKICIYYSSGTTGLPKGKQTPFTVLLDKAKVQFRTLAHLPTAHAAALICYFVNPIYEGGVTYWMPTFNFDDFLRYFGELKITTIFSVPPVFLGISKHPAVKDQFSNLVFVTSGAAPMSKELQDAAKKRMKLDGLFAQTWGMTETSASITWSTPLKENTTGSVGRLLPNTQLRLVDEEEKDVPEGQPGEALVKGPTVVQGYHHNPEANKATFTDDGWLRTGDILCMRSGELFVVDRKKEMIKYKAFQVAPAELEGIIASHPAILDAAVIGVPQNHTEVPRAYVVLAPPAKGKISEEDIIDFVKNKVTDYKRLRGGVRLVDAVPRSASGKILRKELREKRKLEDQASKL
ncbi:unnamed protein product [Clonostachys rosea]|uniref:AMP-dependent synthetase/ligase domain-containing protein n=1 Tax=Bionectria ochroleuca TaxID=29856 RepID=A0ABY6TRE0_BIOOC|nr:unnamed protein product [Clonostachys rosea]